MGGGGIQRGPKYDHSYLIAWSFWEEGGDKRGPKYDRRIFEQSLIEVGKYNGENTNTDFDSDLVVDGVVLELQSLSSLLKNF